MHRLIGLIVPLFLISIVSAEGQDNMINKVKLQCNITFSNYDNIEYTAKTVEVALNNYKHKSGGMIMVTQTKDYEFWVMTHGIQKINKRAFINTFQVAIKKKGNNLFMHALSDITHSPENPPKQARISLVDYDSNSSLEKGELCFECMSIKSAEGN
jgi:hypothetical protein